MKNEGKLTRRVGLHWRRFELELGVGSLELAAQSGAHVASEPGIAAA